MATTWAGSSVGALKRRDLTSSLLKADWAAETMMAPPKVWKTVEKGGIVSLFLIGLRSVDDDGSTTYLAEGEGVCKWR